jgi:hypothetical protein
MTIILTQEELIQWFGSYGNANPSSLNDRGPCPIFLAEMITISQVAEHPIDNISAWRPKKECRKDSKERCGGWLPTSIQGIQQEDGLFLSRVGWWWRFTNKALGKLCAYSSSSNKFWHRKASTPKLHTSFLRPPHGKEKPTTQRLATNSSMRCHGLMKVELGMAPFSCSGTFKHLFKVGSKRMKFLHRRKWILTIV